MRDGGVSVDDVDAVVMVGGSTRVPRVRERVSDYFGREPLLGIDPDRVVAIGAALQADVLAGNKQEGDMLRAQEFTTFKDGQVAMAIHVVQGERELVKDCRSLARFELHGIPPMVAGAARIRVTFTVDADGLLSVDAEEASTGVKSSIVVKPSYGLSDDEIADMLRDAIDHAGDDAAMRRLREEQVEGERVVEALKPALAEDGAALLEAGERGTIDAALADLERVVRGDDLSAIQDAVARLEKTCEFYVERRMNRSIHEAMAGHKVDDFKHE